MSVRIQPEDGQSYEYVIGGAKMKCSQGTVLSPIISNDRETTFQDKNICAVTDDDPKKNNFNFGFCKAMQKPCVGCIQLLKWENYKKNAVIGEEEAFALLDKSTIKCTKGGIISFEDTGQEGDERLITGLIIYGEEAVESSKLQLTKVAYHTTYDICSDDLGLLYKEKNEKGEVIAIKSQDDSDYIKTYILEDEGEYYHWLHIRHNENDASAVKPPIIPITFASNETIKLKAILSLQSKENINKEKIQIRVTQIVGMRNKDNVSYNFKVTSFKQSDKNKNEYEVEVESTNLPYKDTIRYFETFELLFEYSEDGENWYRTGTCKNTLYLTWRKPTYNKFPENERMEFILDSPYTKKPFLFETILWLGCQQANGLGKEFEDNIKNEEKILDKIFKIFETRRITRAREGTPYLTEELTNKSLGYWRGYSSLEDDENKTDFFENYRSIRFLLSYGEARCGEWTDFLSVILSVQGIYTFEKVAISIDDRENGLIDNNFNKGKNIEYVLKKYKKKIQGISYEPYIRYSDWHKGTKELKNKELENYNLLFILVKNCEFVFGKVDIQNSLFVEQSIDNNAICNSSSKKSKAQGNDDAFSTFGDHVWLRHIPTRRFYDPSYGISLPKEETYLNDYLKKMTDGLLFYKIDNNGNYLCIRHYRNMPLNKNLKISHKINDKDAYLYLHTTKQDI